MDPKEDIRRVMMPFAIKKVLWGLEKTYFDIVNEKVQKEYQTTLHACYDDPVLFERVIADVFGSRAHQIIDMVYEELDGFIGQKSLSWAYRPSDR